MPVYNFICINLYRVYCTCECNSSTSILVRDITPWNNYNSFAVFTFYVWWLSTPYINISYAHNLIFFPFVIYIYGRSWYISGSHHVKVWHNAYLTFETGCRTVGQALSAALKCLGLCRHSRRKGRLSCRVINQTLLEYVRAWGAAPWGPRRVGYSHVTWMLGSHVGLFRLTATKANTYPTWSLYW